MAFKRVVRGLDLVLGFFRDLAGVDKSSRALWAHGLYRQFLTDNGK